MKLTGTQLGDFGRFSNGLREKSLACAAFEEGVRSERERVLDIIDDAEQRGGLAWGEKKTLVAAIRLDHIN